MSCAFDKAVTSSSRQYGLILVSEDFHTWKGWGRAEHTVTPGQGCRVTRLCDGIGSGSGAGSWWWSLWFRLPISIASTTEWSLMNTAGSPQRLQWLLGSLAAPLGPRSRTGGGEWNQWCTYTQLWGSAIDAYAVAGASRRHTPSLGCQGRQEGPGPTVSTLAAARVPGCLHVLPWPHSLPRLCIRQGRCLQWQESSWQWTSAQLEELAPSKHTVIEHLGCCRVLTQRPGPAAGEVPGL